MGAARWSTNPPKSSKPPRRMGHRHDNSPLRFVALCSYNISHTQDHAHEDSNQEPAPLSLSLSLIHLTQTEVRYKNSGPSRVPQSPSAVPQVAVSLSPSSIYKSQDKHRAQRAAPREGVACVAGSWYRLHATQLSTALNLPGRQPSNNRAVCEARCCLPRGRRPHTPHQDPPCLVRRP